MPRIRSIKPEFWASESLGTRLPGPDGRQARLLFIALWNHAEDHGVCRASPALLRSVAFPYDEDVTAGDVARWLGMLVAGGFVVRYERQGSTYAWIRAFDEHQKIDRKSKTTLPEPSQQECEARASHRDMSHSPASETAVAVTSPRRALDEPSLQEGRGREGKGEDSASQANAAASPPPEDDLPDGTAFALEAQEPSAPPAKKAREAPPGEVLYFRLEAIRKGECERADVPFVPSRWAYSRQNKDLGPIAKLPDGHEEKVRFEAAWGAFLDDPQARDLDEPFSLSFFWRMRSRYEGRGLRAAS